LSHRLFKGIGLCQLGTFRKSAVGKKSQISGFLELKKQVERVRVIIRDFMRRV
jgi:hypothetical protein